MKKTVRAVRPKADNKRLVGPGCYNFGVSFVQFGGEMKHKMPQEGVPSNNLSREEDEESSSKRHCFGIFLFSPSIYDFLIKPIIGFKLSILFNFAPGKLQFSSRFYCHFHFGSWSRISSI